MVKFLKNQVKTIQQDKISAHYNYVELEVVQQPIKARVSGKKETRNSSRRLVDPQPIVQIKLNDSGRNIINHSIGIYFIRASLECVGFKDKESLLAKQKKFKNGGATNNTNNDYTDEDAFDILRGNTSATAQFFKDSPYAACCVFDNLSVRFKGVYRLKFDLFEIRSFSEDSDLPTIKSKIIHWKQATTFSSQFTVYTDASFDGLEASPILNEQLKKAGCKIRTRKPKNQGILPFADNFKIKKSRYTTPFQYLSHLSTMSPHIYNNLLQQQVLSSPHYNNYTMANLFQRQQQNPINDVFSTPSRSKLMNSPYNVNQYFFSPQTAPQLQSSDTNNLETFSTPSIFLPKENNNENIFENTIFLDYSPLETEVVPQSNNTNNYILSSNPQQQLLPPAKLDFNNSEFYQSFSDELQNQQTNEAPRSQDYLFHAMMPQSQEQSNDPDIYYSNTLENNSNDVPNQALKMFVNPMYMANLDFDF